MGVEQHSIVGREENAREKGENENDMH